MRPITGSPGLTAIVVDDLRWLASALAERLALSGFQADVAGSVAEATSAFDCRSYNVAFVDLGLPDGTGLDLAAELKRRHPSLKVVLITGFTANADDPAMNTGSVDVVLPKPWTPGELEAVLTKVRGSG